MLESFLSLLYPRVCVHCKRSLVKGEENLCSKCLDNLPVNEQLGNFHELRHAIFSSYMFRSLFYFLKFYKSGITQSLLHQIKYEGNTDLATRLGMWYGSQLERAGFINNFDLVIPVPLHKRKLKLRGYNQSDFIAAGLTQILNARVDANFLKREINNPTQTRKSRVERMENVKGVFRLRHTRHSLSSRILLVDDVLTTGATLESCAAVLAGEGYSELSFATVAYAKK